MLSKKFILIFVLTSVTVINSFSQYLDKFDKFQFFKNYGQWDHQVQYGVATSNGTYFFTEKGFGVVVSKGEKKKPEMHPFVDEAHNHGHNHTSESYDFYMSNFTLKNGSNILWKGNDQNKVSYSFFKGKKEKWVKGARTYNRLESNEVYEGIRSRFYGKDGLKYEFLVAPNANPNRIQLVYEGPSVELMDNGELVFDAGYSQITESAPYAYQLIDGRQVQVACKYRLKDNVISYKLGRYDKSKELIIDPKLIFSTSAGSTADFWGNTACNDQFGNLYTAGTVFPHTGGGQWEFRFDPVTGTSGWVFVRTPDLDGLPTTPGAFQTSAQGGDTDVGVMKFDSSGTTLLYATYLGGNDTDLPISTVVDRNTGELLILITTGSTNFPMSTLRGYDTTFNGGQFIPGAQLVGGYDVQNGTDIAVVRLNATGTDIINSTYLGGDGNDGIGYNTNSTTYNYGDELRGDIYIGDDGGVIVSSVTQIHDTIPFPGLGFSPTYGGGQSDGVVFKFSSDLTTLEWSNLLGGVGTDVAFSVKEDSLGNVLVAGGSEGGMNNFPSGGAKDTVSGDVDGFILKITPDGLSSISGTYFGDTLFDQIYFIDLDEFGNVFALGQTDSVLPIIPSDTLVYNNKRNGLFLTKFSPTLDSLIILTTLGDTTNPSEVTPNISPTAFLVNDCGNIFISGWGGEINARYRGDVVKNMPIQGDSYKSVTDGDDLYLMVLFRDAELLLYSTYFGGGISREHVDGGTSRFDKSGTIYQSVCANCGGNQDFPTFPDDGNQNTYPMRNKSENCNNGTFKFDLANLEAIIDGPECLVEDSLYGFANLSIGGRDYYWDFGDGTPPVITENSDSVFHQYENWGDYRIMMVATDLVTCVGKDTVYFDVTVLNQISVNGNNSVCPGESTVLSVSNAFNPEWSPASFLSCTECDNPTATPPDTMYFYVKDSLGTGCSVTDSVLVIVKPIIEPIIDGPSCLVVDEEYGFANTGEWGYEYTWNFGDGTNEVVTNQKDSVFHTYDDGGTYIITMTAKDSITCPEEDNVSLQVFVLNQITASGDTVVCARDTIDLTVDGAFNPQWSPSQYVTCENCTTTGAFAPDTMYFYVRDSLGNGCVITDSILINTKINPKPSVLIDYTPQRCYPEPVQFSYKTNQLEDCECCVPLEFFLWEFGDGTSSTEKSPVHVFPSEGIWNVRLTAWSERETVFDQADVELYPLDSCFKNIYIPNAFTPNDDGENDILYVRGINIIDLEFRLYNRWGEEVFMTESLSFGWDGIFKGQKQTQQVFVYKCYATFYDGEKVELEGNVTLME